MSSIEPNDGGGELNGGQEIALGFVVAGRDGTELLEFGEEVLDQMKRFKQVSIVVTTDLAIGFGGNDRELTGRGERLDDPFIGVECFVGKERVGLHARQKVIGTDEIVGFAAGQEQVDGVAQRVDQGMDFGAQSAARAADRLVFAGFFWAPALC